MSDKSWMLNAKAIARAKQCINLVESELGIRLKLSNPDFLELLISYAELNESESLQQGLNSLAEFAPPELQDAMKNAIKVQEPDTLTTTPTSAPENFSIEGGSELVSYRGKSYPRYRDGLEFKGLYRGQPNYS